MGKNRRRSTYLILDNPIHRNGLFSIFTMVLGLLKMYDSGQCIGCEVNFENKGVYYDETFGLNWWEYYFEPIKLGNKNGIIKKIGNNQKIKLSSQCEYNTSRDQNHIYIEKYIHLKPHILEKIKQFKDTYFTEHMIGVHYRGTDKVIEAPRIPYESVFEKINYILQTSTDSHLYKIYIATDEQSFLEYMKEQFHEKIVFLEGIYRSSNNNNNPIHHLETDMNYKKGEEAVLDCILLSHCDILIRTSSNLSLVSTFFNNLMPIIELSTRY